MDTSSDGGDANSHPDSVPLSSVKKKTILKDAINADETEGLLFPTPRQPSSIRIRAKDVGQNISPDTTDSGSFSDMRFEFRDTVNIQFGQLSQVNLIQTREQQLLTAPRQRVKDTYFRGVGQTEERLIFLSPHQSKSSKCGGLSDVVRYSGANVDNVDNANVIITKSQLPLQGPFCGFQSTDINLNAIRRSTVPNNI